MLVVFHAVLCSAGVSASADAAFRWAGVGLGGSPGDLPRGAFRGGGVVLVDLEGLRLPVTFLAAPGIPLSVERFADFIRVASSHPWASPSQSHIQLAAHFFLN